MNPSRRKVFTAAAALVAAAGGWALLRRDGNLPPEQEPKPLALAPDPLFPNPLHVPGDAELNGIADASGALTLVGTQMRREILRGKPARLLAYTLEQNGRTLINPLLRTDSGANLRIRYWNALDETSIVHWHGLLNETNNDGHPHYAVGPGETYDYQFTVANRAGTYWYHPHPHHLAGKQAYLGLTGLFVVEDEEEVALQRALDLKLGATDIPLLIQDKRFTPEGELAYSPAGLEHFHGFCGDTVLINLTPSPCLDCDARLYRFRLVNGSNARVYRLAFVHGEEALPFHVIGADGGLLERPLVARELFLSPSERADVLLDLRRASAGERIVLASLAFDAMTFSERRSDTNAAATAIGSPLELMLIRVVRKAPYDREIPAVLSAIAPVQAGEARKRLFTLDQSKGIWRINRATYRMTETAFSVDRGAREIWEFTNPRPAMPHPIHVHGFQYRMLERRGSPEHVRHLAVDDRGLPPAELGWKDTVLLWPGETLKMLIDFTHPFSGDQVYMLQCHNLEHESHGMMVNFRVRET